MAKKRNILLITNDVEQHHRLQCMTKAGDAKYADITWIQEISDVTQSVLSMNFDVAIIDMTLSSDMKSTLELIGNIQASNKDLPVIVLFEERDDKAIVRALSHGVQDYLIKDYESGEVMRRAIRYAVQRKRYEEKIAYLTMQDHLTGLMNTEMIPSAIQQAMNSAKREKSLLALYYVDIDNFKGINDEHGHDVGNALLSDVASRLQDTLDENSILARMSADIFVIIDVAEDLDACAVLAEEIMSVMNYQFNIATISFPVKATIGVATYPECGTRHTELMRHAEMALRQAKASERGSYKFFSSELNQEVMQRIRITTALKQSVSGDSFSLHYQPKVDLESLSLVGVEALIRWQHPSYGNIRPDQFIPLAEESGLIHHISEWVSRTACNDHANMPLPTLDMSINISARELCNEDIIGITRNIINDTGMNAEQLVMEITETAMMADTKTAMQVMYKLRDLGIKLHIDDFGIGYSSIDYLRRFPVDALKIDRSFVMNMQSKPDDVRVVKLMIDIAHELGMYVIAEGVEIAEQQHLLHGMQCDVAQGYLFARPMPLHDLQGWYKAFIGEHANTDTDNIAACGNS